MSNGSSEFLTKREATNGYRKAQAEMKAMTSEMRSLRVAIGAELCWNWSGGISYVKIGDKRILAKYFKQYYEAEMFEQEFFNG